MAVLTHILAIAAYALAAFLAALIVAAAVPGAGVVEAVAAGAFLFVCGALAHEIACRRLGQRSLAHALLATHETAADAVADLDIAHREIARLRQEVVALENTARQRIDSEVAVVKTLLGQLYRHLESGRVRVQPAAGPLQAIGAVFAGPAGGDLQVIESLHDALENNRIDLYLQPIVSLPQRKVRYYEALSRLRDADGNLLTPDRYLGVAEKSGLIGTIDNLLLFRCTQILRKTKHQKNSVGFFCNLAQHTLRDERFFQQFIDFLSSLPELADSLIFEISASDLAACGPSENDKLDRLVRTGCRLSLDRLPHLDFDFAGLARRHFHFVKIEAAKILSPREQAGIPIAATDLKDALRRNGIDLIAEKIENERTVVDLMDYNVDFGQGFLFGEPRPSREADVPSKVA
jgi:cyclic-di-GMP phosphodiesterase TipF (flagellum assembly factor)